MLYPATATAFLNVVSQLTLNHPAQVRVITSMGRKNAAQVQAMPVSVALLKLYSLTRKAQAVVVASDITSFTCNASVV